MVGGERVRKGKMNTSRSHLEVAWDVRAVMGGKRGGGVRKWRKRVVRSFDASSQISQRDRDVVDFLVNARGVKNNSYAMCRVQLGRGRWTCEVDEVDDFRERQLVSEGAPSVVFCDVWSVRRVNDRRLITGS